MSYRNLLEKIHLTFPQPVSDAIHNSYFVHLIMRALDQADELKTDLPMLGETVDGDFDKAKEATVPGNMATIEKVTEDLVRYL